MEKENDPKAVLERIETGVNGMGNRFKEVEERMGKIETRIGDWEKVEKTRQISLPGVEHGDGKRKFSFLRAFNGILFNEWKGGEFELDVFKQTGKLRGMGAGEIRDMSAGTDSAGGYLVPVEVVKGVLEILRSKLVLNALGATFLTGLKGAPVEMTKQDSTSTGYWVAESGAITASDVSVGQITMYPRLAAALAKLSRRVVEMSDPSIEAFVIDDIAKVLARLVELGALRGTGGSNQPLGLVNQAGINAVAIATDGGEITYDHIIDMEGELDDDDALDGKLAFLTAPKGRRKLRKLKDADGRPLLHWDRSVAAAGGVGAAKTLLEYPFLTTTQVPVNLTKGAGTALTELYFGNWADLLIGQWGGLTFERTTLGDTAFQNHQAWVKAVMEVDIAVRRPKSFCLINDMETV